MKKFQFYVAMHSPSFFPPSSQNESLVGLLSLIPGMAQRLSTATIFLSEFIAGGWAEGSVYGETGVVDGFCFC